MNELHGSYKLKIQKTTELGLAFSHYLMARMKHDRVNVNAGYLAYITLLSIVPMLAVLLSILSSFSVFADVGVVIQKFIINNFVPASGDAVHNALQEFVANTGKMTAVGSGFLFIAAMMLISNIDKNLNYIWRVKGKASSSSFVLYVLDGINSWANFGGCEHCCDILRDFAYFAAK